MHYLSVVSVITNLTIISIPLVYYSMDMLYKIKYS